MTEHYLFNQIIILSGIIVIQREKQRTVRNFFVDFHCFLLHRTRSLSQLWSLRRKSRIKMVKFMAKITAISIFSDSNLGLLEGKKNSADMVLSEKEDKFYVLVAH